MNEIVTVILAAGKGTRMKSKLVKVLHPLMGMPMLSFPIEVAKKIKSKKIILVIGYQRDRIKKSFQGEGLIFVEQRDQLGTGHAVLCTKDVLKGFDGDVLILCGDVPLVKEKTVRSLLDLHQRKNSMATVLTTKLENPKGYGRIIRGERGEIVSIVEEKDANEGEKKIKEVNTGIYCVKSHYLFQALEKVDKKNTQSEYYLTDIIAIANEEKRRVEGFLAEDSTEVMGINDRIEIAKATELIRQEILQEFMTNGVSIFDPKTTFIEKDVQIGEDTVIYPNCHIRGHTAIGIECLVEPGSVISDSKIGNRVIIKPFCVLNQSNIVDEEIVGPFAHMDNSGYRGKKQVQNKEIKKRKTKY